MNEHLRNRLITEFPEWHEKPLRLSIKEIDQPFLVFQSFFEAHRLPGVRACMQELLHDAIMDEGANGSNHITIHEEVVKLVEAVWVVYQSYLSEDGKNVKTTENALNDQWQKIDDFFGEHDLESAAEDLWQMTKISLTCNDDEVEADQRALFLGLFENTKSLYATVHELLEQEKAKL